MSTMETPIEIPDLRKPGTTSLEGLHGSVPVPPTNAGFWRQMLAFAGPAFLVSVGYMDPGNWGTDLAGRRAVSLRPPLGGRRCQSDGDRYAGPLRPAGPGDGEGPGPGLPRLLSALDPRAELAGLRGRHRGLRPGRGARQRRGDQPSLPHPPVLGRPHHRFRRAAAAQPARDGHARHRGGHPGPRLHHRRLLLHRDFRPAANATQLLGNGVRPADARVPPGRHARAGHRHHRGDGDAAQPVPAFGPCPLPQVAGRGSRWSAGRSSSTRSTRWRP